MRNLQNIIALWDTKMNKLVVKSKEEVLLLYKDEMDKEFVEEFKLLESEKLIAISSKMLEGCIIKLMEKLWQPLDQEDLDKEVLWLRVVLEEEQKRYVSMNEVRLSRAQESLDELITKCLNQYTQKMSDRWEETPFMDQANLQVCHEFCKMFAIEIFNKENKFGFQIDSTQLNNALNNGFEQYKAQVNEAENFVDTNMNKVVQFCYSNEEINTEMNNAWKEDTHFQLISFLQNTVDGLLSRKSKFVINSLANGMNFCLEIQKKLFTIYETFLWKFSVSTSDRNERNAKAVDEAFDFYVKKIPTGSAVELSECFETDNLRRIHEDLKQRANEIFNKTLYVNIGLCSKQQLDQRIEFEFEKISSINEFKKSKFVNESKEQVIISFKTLMMNEELLNESIDETKLKFVSEFKAKVGDKLNEQNLTEELSSLEIQLDEERKKILAESQNNITKALEKLVESSVNEYEKYMNEQLDMDPFMDYANLLQINSDYRTNSIERFNKSVEKVTKGKESSKDLINLFTKKQKNKVTAAFQKWENKYFLKVNETDKIAETILNQIVAFYNRKIRTDIEDLLNESDLKTKHNHLLDVSLRVFNLRNPYFKNLAHSKRYHSKIKKRLFTGYKTVLEEFSQPKKAKLSEESQVKRTMITKHEEIEICSENSNSSRTNDINSHIQQVVCDKECDRIESPLKAWLSCPLWSNPNKSLFVAHGRTVFIDKSIWGVPPLQEEVPDDTHQEEWLSRAIHPSNVSNSSNGDQKYTCMICGEEDQEKEVMRNSNDVILHMYGIPHRTALDQGYSHSNLQQIGSSGMLPNVFP